MHSLDRNADKSPSRWCWSTIFEKDPHLRLKIMKLGLTIDLKEGRKEMAMVQGMEAKGQEEEEAPRLERKARKMAAPRKRKQAASGSSSTPKRAKVHFAKFHQHSLLFSFLHIYIFYYSPVLLSRHTEVALCYFTGRRGISSLYQKQSRLFPSRSSRARKSKRISSVSR